MEYGTCAACGRQVVYARTAANGKRMLIDPVPTEDGNVLVDGFGLAHVFRNPVVARATREAASDVELASADQHSVHYATCPARRHAATVDGQEALL